MGEVNTHGSLNTSVSSQTLLLQWFVSVCATDTSLPEEKKKSLKFNCFYLFRYQMKTTLLPHYHEQGLKVTGMVPTALWNLQDDASFCPHPESFTPMPCQRVSQLPISPLLLQQEPGCRSDWAEMCTPGFHPDVESGHSKMPAPCPTV